MARVISSPRCASASRRSLARIIAEISGGVNVLPWTSTAARSFWPRVTLYGTRAISVVISLILPPIKRLIEKTVFCGFVTACRLAI